MATAKLRHAGRPWQRLRRRVIAEESVCGLCGVEVDKTLRYPHPMSASVDLKVALSQGGSWRDRTNLSLAHLICNVRAQAKVPKRKRKPQPFVTSQPW